MEVNKVAGNFHFAPGKSFQQSNVHVHDLLAFQKDSFNVRLNSTSFSLSKEIKHLLLELMSLKKMKFEHLLWELVSEENEILSNLLIILCWTSYLINLYDVIQVSHKINRLTFGEYFPGVVNPLDG